MVRPGRGFDGSQGQDFGEFLRRELHAAGDADPAGRRRPGADPREDPVPVGPRHRAARGDGHLGGHRGVRDPAVPAPGLAGPATVPRRGSAPPSGGRRSSPETGTRRCSGRPSPLAWPCSSSGWSWPSCLLLAAISPTSARISARPSAVLPLRPVRTRRAASRIAPGSTGAGLSSSNIAGIAPPVKLTPCSSASTHASAKPTTSGSSGSASSPTQASVTTSPVVSSSGDDSSGSASPAASPSDSPSPSPQRHGDLQPEPQRHGDLQPEPERHGDLQPEPPREPIRASHQGRARADRQAARPRRRARPLPRRPRAGPRRRQRRRDGRQRRRPRRRPLRTSSPCPR